MQKTYETKQKRKLSHFCILKNVKNVKRNNNN